MDNPMQQVSFIGVKETYPQGNPVQCRYVIKQPFVATARDWIGLYRVGWHSCDKYETYVWVQLPEASGDSKDADCEGIVTFAAGTLPKDSKDFFQFCYVSSARQVCGVSAPFQLCTSVEDLFEVQDPDDPTTMVIKTRSQVLEEQVAALKKERLELQKEAQLLQVELDAERVSKGQLMTQIQRFAEMQLQLETQTSDNVLLQQQIKELQDTLQTERKSNEQLHDLIRGMRDELLAERKAREESPPHPSKETQLLQIDLDTEQEKRNEDIQPGASAKVQSAEDQPDGAKSSLTTVSKTDDGFDRTEATESLSAVSDDGSKQMSFTDRISGSVGTVLKHLKRASDWLAEDFEDEEAKEIESGPPPPTDKVEQSLRLCPVCNDQFPENASDGEISAHIEHHNGQVCPICFMQFNQDYPDDHVTAHVNSHLDDANALLSF